MPVLARYLAPLDLFAGHPNLVASGVVNAPSQKTSHEVDVTVLGLDDDNRRPLLAIGEVKWGEVMGLGHLERLRRIRSLLVQQERHGAETAKLACFAAQGFTDDLKSIAEEDRDVVLVAAGDLYQR